MDDNNIIWIVLAGVAAVVVAGLGSAQAQLPSIPSPTTGTPGNSSDSWVPTDPSGEIGVDVETGVTYDDPETGPANDEPADDPNSSFEDANTNDSSIDDTDPASYAPDVEDGATAPSDPDGSLADPGTSQNYGSAPEQENDDLTERAADSNLSDDLKSAFDRYANKDF